MFWIGLCVFVAVFCGVVWLHQLTTYRRARRGLTDHLRRWTADGPHQSGFLLAWAERFDQGPAAVKIALEMARADLRLRPSEFVALQCMLGLGAYLLTSIFMGLAFPLSLMVASLGLYVGVRVFLNSRRHRYVSRFNHELPELCRLMSNALKAGLSIHQAIELAGNELPAPIGPEMRTSSHEIRLAVPLDRVLDNLMNRVDSSDLRLLCTTITVQWEVGGDLASALADMAHTLSEREQAMGEIRGLTAEQRFVAIMLPFMPLIAAILMNMAIPGFLNPIFTVPGMILVTVFAVVEVVAYLIVRSISNIQV